MHDIQRHTPLKKSRRVGRGGKRGKTSGRGTKGQKARAGHKMRPELRDIIKKIPKRRGYGKNRARTVNPLRAYPVAVTIAAIEKAFPVGATITPAALLEKRMIRPVKGRVPKVKILHTGNATKKMTFAGILFSKDAKEAIEKAGSTIIS